MTPAAKSPSLPHRLAARAFALAIDPRLSPDAAGSSLLYSARGSKVALARALHRVESDLADRPTRLAEAAALALRAALASSGPGDTPGRPSLVSAPGR